MEWSAKVCCTTWSDKESFKSDKLIPKYIKTDKIVCVQLDSVSVYVGFWKCLIPKYIKIDKIACVELDSVSVYVKNCLHPKNNSHS